MEVVALRTPNTSELPAHNRRGPWRSSPPGLRLPKRWSGLFARSSSAPHEIIAYSKLPDSTFRFCWEEGRLRFYPADRSHFITSGARRSAMSSFVRTWGCGHEQTKTRHPAWPRVERRNLRHQGVQMKIANLFKPGTHAFWGTTYAYSGLLCSTSTCTRGWEALPLNAVLLADHWKLSEMWDRLDPENTISPGKPTVSI